jgi:type I restriction enzyme, S subunit
LLEVDEGESSLIEDLPEGWIWCELGDLAALINGDRGKNYPNRSALVEVGIPFINAGHLEDGIIQMSEMNYINEERFNILGSGKVRPKDILYCLRGSLGKIAIVKDIEKGAIASSLVII